MSLSSAVDVLSGGGGPAIQADGRLLSIYGTLTPLGNYVAGGDSWDLTKMVLPAGWVLPGFGVPMYCWVWSQSAGGNSGFWYQWVPGATLVAQKLQVFQSAAAGNPHSEINAGAYPAGVLADTIKFCLVMSYPA